MRKRKPFLLTLLVFLICGCSVNDFTIFEAKKIENKQENTEENGGNSAENEGKHEEQKPSFSYKINDETTGTFDAVTNSILNQFSNNYTVLEAYAFELGETLANVTFKLFKNNEEVSLKPTGASGNNAAYASDNQTIIFKESALRSTIQLFKYANKVPYYINAQFEPVPETSKCPGCGAEGIVHSKCEHCDGYVCVGNHNARPCGEHYYCETDNLDHTKCEYCNTYHCNGKDHSLKPCGHPNCVIDNLNHSACLHCDGYLCDGNNHSLQQCGQHHHCENDSLSHSICPHCNEYLCNGANHSLRPCGLHYYCEQDSLDHGLCEYCNCYLCDGEDHTLFECGQHALCEHANLNHTQCDYCGGYYCDGNNHQHLTYVTIVFDPNGGDGFAYSTWAWAPCELTFPSNSFTKENHRFIGWKKDGDSTLYQPGDTITINETTTFYAQWEFTGHSYCPGCGAEDVEHDICIYCWHYVCNGQNHNECPHCGGHYCDGGTHSQRPCGHYYCVWDMMDHDICGYCCNYLCQGDHSKCGEVPPEHNKYCPYCQEVNIDPHPLCQYCGNPTCVGDHSNCPPDKTPYSGVSGTFSYQVDIHFEYYWPNYFPSVPTYITGWGHMTIDYTLYWVVTIESNGSGTIKGYLGEALIIDGIFTYVNNNGVLSLSISEYDKTSFDIDWNTWTTIETTEHIVENPVQETTAYIYEDGSVLGLVSFMDHLGAFDVEVNT